MSVPGTQRRVVEGYQLLRIMERRSKGEYGPDPTGLKRQYVPGSDRLHSVTTPFYARLIRRRRAARKVAHESRRRNR